MPVVPVRRYAERFNRHRLQRPYPDVLFCVQNGGTRMTLPYSPATGGQRVIDDIRNIIQAKAPPVD